MFPFKIFQPPIGDSSNLSQGNISTENQWSNPNNYQNVDLETVDWAALAQQWIHMKEVCPPNETVPDAPPPPTISKQNNYRVRDLEEQGEAPMEVVEHDDEPSSSLHSLNTPTKQQIFSTQSNGSRHIHPNWSNISQEPPPLNTKQWQKKTPRWNAWPNSNNTNQPKNFRPPPLLNDPYTSGQAYNHKPNTNVWPMNPSGAFPNAPIGSEPNVQQQMDASLKSGTQLVNIDLMPATLDAAQRKTLPAWIREGLEKMEREKQKEADRIREMKDREEKLKQDRLNAENLNQLKDSLHAEPASFKSKFESDSDEDDESDIEDGKNKNSMDSYKAGSSSQMSSAPTLAIKPHRSKADILQEIMLSVRKNLTEILLEVTNEQIHDIANETLSKMRSKGRKAQTVQKNALTAITGGLGLVIYDDSDGSRSSSDSEDETDNTKHYNEDSEAELEKTIERRKAAFELKSAEIEAFLAENEEKEKHWLEKTNSDQSKPNEFNPDNGHSSSFGKNKNKIESGEIQHEKNKLTTTTGRKMDRKGSRFSDAKGIVYNVSNCVTIPSTTSSYQYTRLNSVEQKPNVKDPIKMLAKHGNDSGSDTTEKSSHSSKGYRSKHDNNLKPTKTEEVHKSKKNEKECRRSTSSSDSSRYSRTSYNRHVHKHSNRSRSRSHSRRSHKRSKYSRSSSDDRTSKSSRSTCDTYSKDKSYCRSHSHRSSKRSRSRSRSYDRSRHRHR